MPLSISDFNDLDYQGDSLLSSSEIEILPSEKLSSVKIQGCGCRATILLADDNPFNLLPLRVILEENYSIYCDLVENGY